MKKNIIRISIAVVWLVSVVLSFYVGMAYHWASTTEIEMSKDYNEIVVEENEIADYTVFIDIPEKYGALKQIEEPVRKTISLYMQANNLKLSVGTHIFNRLDGTLEEYLNEEFKFEVIK